jgi:Fur family transcriptional regulator, zinc uptake regulator
MTMSMHRHVLHEGTSLAVAASEVMKGHGEQWTAMRATVFDALCQLAVPSSAYDVAELVGAKLGRRIAANSVYRILDLFVSHNVALRIESCNAYIANAHPGCVHDCIFLICDVCGKVYHLDDDMVGKSVRAIASHSAFEPLRPLIEVHGHCRACA